MKRTCLPLLPVFLWLLTGAAFAATPAHTLYVCAAVNNNYVIGSTLVTESGLFRLEPSGQWQHLGPNDIGIVAVAFDPRNSEVIYTATLNGCLRSIDGDRHIRVTTDWTLTEPRDVSVDPGAPDHVYLALPDGIVASTDGGQTWTRRETGLPERGKYMQTVAVDRAKAGRVLAGCETGIYLTDDAAAHWRQVLKTVDTVEDLQQSPADSQLWFAVTQSAGGWISRDGGQTWQKVPGLPDAKALYNVSFDATQPKRLAVGSYTYGVLTSEDGGAIWVDRNAGLPEGHHVWRVGVNPDNGRLYASVRGKDIFASDDFGRTWHSAGLPGSAVNDFVFVPNAK